MIKVTYEIREDELESVVETFEKQFMNDEEKRHWERQQSGHPFLHLKEIKCEVI